MTRYDLIRALLVLQWTQAELARRLYVSTRQVNRWTHGDSEIPGPVRAYIEHILACHNQSVSF